jgi:hypothetical protein
MAANPMRGEADFGPHKLIVTFNGLCALEAAMGLKVGDLLHRMETGLSFLETRTCVRCFLNEERSSEQVGDMIGELGFDVALEAIAKALDGFFAPMDKDRKKNPLVE